MQKIKGKVKKGRGLGHTFGYPTANIVCGFYLADGVYYSLVKLEKKWRPSLAIKGVISKGIEVYILDWHGDLYGQELKIKILGKIRELIKFNATEELVEQIRKDILQAEKYFENNFDF